jgi:hypothetical protein
MDQRSQKRAAGQILGCVFIEGMLRDSHTDSNLCPCASLPSPPKPLCLPPPNPFTDPRWLSIRGGDVTARLLPALTACLRPAYLHACRGQTPTQGGSSSSAPLNPPPWPLASLEGAVGVEVEPVWSPDDERDLALATHLLAGCRLAVRGEAHHNTTKKSRA